MNADATPETAQPPAEIPEPKAKRARKSGAPARPHKRLPAETLDLRIAKLEKRREHAKAQIEDATKHIEAYQKEKLLREASAEEATKHTEAEAPGAE